MTKQDRAEITEIEKKLDLIMKKDEECPSCGRCKECGRSDRVPYPVPYYPQPWVYPWYGNTGITYTDSVRVTTGQLATTPIETVSAYRLEGGNS